MAIDQAFIIQQIKKKETLYAAFCMNTKMPFIICDPDTYNDQVWVFDGEDALKKFVEEYAQKKYLIRGAKMEQKQFGGFFASLYTLDVNEIVYVSDDTVSKIASLSLRDVRIEDVNETALEAFERMKKDLPFSARSGLSLGIGEKNAVRKAAVKIPQTAGWIFPGFTTAYSSGVTYVTLYAPDEACLENAVSEFRENMRRNSLTFRVMKHVHETVPASADDDVFTELEKAFVSAGLTKTLIPVLSKEDYTIRGIRTLSIPSKHMDRRTVDKLLMGLLLGA